MKHNRFATYSAHHFDQSQGHIFLNKDGACTITLQGAASMSQDELNKYGELMTSALNGVSGQHDSSFRIEKLIELNADYRTAVNFATDLRYPPNGIHAEVVESKVNEDCWNVRMVINS